MSTDQLAALRDLTRAGVLSAEQEEAVRAALDDSGKVRGGTAQVGRGRAHCGGQRDRQRG